MKRIIFLCHQNSCRSQISEAIVNHYYNERLAAKSAGINPSEVNPYAIKVLKEWKIDTKNLYSKHMEEFKGQYFDYIITLCDELKGQCPVYLGNGKKIHWDIKDPADFKGTEEEKIEIFRKTRDKLKKRIDKLIIEMN